MIEKKQYISWLVLYVCACSLFISGNINAASLDGKALDSGSMSASSENSQTCKPIKHNRSIEGLRIAEGTSTSKSLHVDVALHVSGSDIPKLDADLIVYINGQERLRKAIHFTVPTTAAACGMLDDFTCSGKCGTSGNFTCKGLVISGGMFCGCSVLRVEEVGPIPINKGDRLSIAVMPADGTQSEILSNDDQINIEVRNHDNVLNWSRPTVGGRDYDLTSIVWE